MDIRATNNFRYKLIRDKENVYVVDWLPHWYSIFAGVFICFFEKKAYSLTEQQAAFLERRGGMDSPSLFGGPILTILFCTAARAISRQVNIEGRVNGPVFILILLFAVFVLYGIWRKRKGLKLKKCLESSSEACTIKIICKKLNEESKLYFSCAVVELIFQGGMYAIILWFCFYPTVILDTKIIILTTCTIFLYFFSAGFIPDRLFAGLKVMRGERKDA